MEFSLQKRRKLLLLFLLGIGLPSLALSLLAFRGIQNELALLEQRRLEEHRALANAVGETLATHIEGVESALADAVAGRQDLSPRALAQSLDSLKARFPLIEAAFLLDASGSIHLSTADLLFRADGSDQAAPAPAWTGPASEFLRTAQREEFREERYEEAAAAYQRAFEATSDSVQKGEALLALSRVWRKAGRWDEALRVCQDLLRDFDDVHSPEGMPLGAIALLEEGPLHLLAGDSLAALRSGVRFHVQLVNGRWGLQRAQYNFLSGLAATSAGELSRALTGPTVDSLEQAFLASVAMEDARRNRAERALLFQASAGGDLRERIGRDGGPAGAGPFRYSLDSGGETFLVSLLSPVGESGGVWGVLLNTGYLGRSVVESAIDVQLGSESTEWVVRGRDGNVVLARGGQPVGSPVLTTAFAGNFPPWLMEFYPPQENPYRRLFASGQSIYLYMFLAIATILSFGLVLTIRAVTHELALARLKSDFVSTVSHEFKSPLTSIRQLSEMLQAGRVPSEERRQRYYDVLAEQSSRLSALVTNVLDLARIEEGRAEFRRDPVELGKVVRDLVEATQHRVGHGGFRITAHVGEPMPKVEGDEEALRQAVSNLLNNAIQYSGDSRQIDITTAAEGEVVVVSVKDSGIGIPSGELEKIFDRFFRGSSGPARSTRGSGLGLTLVKEIVDAHGGRVDVSSEVGKGSTFRIELPALSEHRSLSG